MNSEELRDAMIVTTSNGYDVIVDAEDYSILSTKTWRARERWGIWYARWHGRKGGRQFSIAMHRMILGVTDPEIKVDHINRNGLDNRKCNLRLCTASQNGVNTISRVGTSRYKGVHWHRGINKWVASIGFQRKRIHLGSFGSELEAAAAYDLAAVKLFGDFARLNLTDDQEAEVSRVVTTGR